MVKLTVDSSSTASYEQTSESVHSPGGKRKTKLKGGAREKTALVPTTKSTLENAGPDGRPRHVFITANGKVRLRRKRVPLEPWQRDILETAFKAGSIPSGRAGRPFIQQLTEKTNMEYSRVAKWVENRYAKERLLKRRKLLLEGFAPDVYKARLPNKEIQKLAAKNSDLAQQAINANKSRMERAKARGKAIENFDSELKANAINEGTTLDELKLNPLQTIEQEADYGGLETGYEQMPTSKEERFGYINKFLSGKIKPQTHHSTNYQLPWPTVSQTNGGVCTDLFLEKLTLNYYLRPLQVTQEILNHGELTVLEEHLDLAPAGLKTALMYFWLAKLGERKSSQYWRCFEFILRSVSSVSYLHKCMPELVNRGTLTDVMFKPAPYSGLKDGKKPKSKFKPTPVASIAL